MTELVWVRAPHFTAGLVIARSRDGMVRVIETAPILKWTRGKDWRSVQRYFSRKRYEVVVMPDPAVNT